MLSHLKAKYGLGDGAKYEPKSDCRKCHGAGEFPGVDSRMRFCICLFVAPEHVELAQDTLAETARKLLGREPRGGV